MRIGQELRDRLKRGKDEAIRCACMYKALENIEDKVKKGEDTTQDGIIYFGEVVSNLLLKVALPGILLGPLGAAGGFVVYASEMGAVYCRKSNLKHNPNGV